MAPLAAPAAAEAPTRSEELPPPLPVDTFAPRGDEVLLLLRCEGAPPTVAQAASDDAWVSRVCVATGGELFQKPPGWSSDRGAPRKTPGARVPYNVGFPNNAAPFGKVRAHDMRAMCAPARTQRGLPASRRLAAKHMWRCFAESAPCNLSRRGRAARA